MSLRSVDKFPRGDVHLSVPSCISKECEDKKPPLLSRFPISPSSIIILNCTRYRAPLSSLLTFQISSSQTTLVGRRNVERVRTWTFDRGNAWIFVGRGWFSAVLGIYYIGIFRDVVFNERDKVLDRKFGSEILEIEYFIASLGRLCNSIVDQYLWMVVINFTMIWMNVCVCVCMCFNLFPPEVFVFRRAVK